MAGTKDPCTLPKDMRCCAGGIGCAYVCHGCGWMAAEQERWPSYTSPVGGYVIVVGGKRINIRRNECIEV